MTVRSRRSLILPNAIRRSMAYPRGAGRHVINGYPAAAGIPPGGDTSLVFDALTYDPNTYEMLGVKTGIGGLTFARGSERYVADHNGVYQLIPAGAPAWSGARYSGGVAYADDGAGTLLSPLPWLSGDPAATNVLLNSNVAGSQGVTLAVGAWSVVVHVNAGDNASAIVTSGTATATGYGTATPGSPIELDVTVEGTVNVEITGAPFAVNLLNLPQAQAKGIAPIPTEGTEVSVQGDGPSFDVANHSNTRGAYYLEWKPSYAGTGVSLGLINTRNAAEGILYDGTGDRINTFDGTNYGWSETPWPSNQTNKVALVYDADEGSMQVNLNGEWGSVKTYDGDYILGAVMTLFFGQLHSNEMRNLQRYDLPYAEAQAKIDELMN